MTDLVKIAVDAMGGDGSPKKTIDGIVHHHKKNKDVFYKIFGNKSEITPFIDGKILKTTKIKKHYKKYMILLLDN